MSSPAQLVVAPARAASGTCHRRTAFAGVDGRAVSRTHAKGMLALLFPAILLLVLGSRLAAGADLELEQPPANAAAMVRGTIASAAIGDEIICSAAGFDRAAHAVGCRWLRPRRLVPVHAFQYCSLLNGTAVWYGAVQYGTRFRGHWTREGTRRRRTPSLNRRTRPACA